VNENLSKDIWSMSYKIVMQKIKTKGVMNTLKKEDGTFTTNWLDTMELILLKLFPDDNEDEDNEENTRIRQVTGHPPNVDENQELPLITNKKVTAAIKTNKALGPDGIKNKIYKCFSEFWKTYLTKLYNECMSQGRFPKV